MRHNILKHLMIARWSKNIYISFSTVTVNYERLQKNYFKLSEMLIEIPIDCHRPKINFKLAKIE